MTRERELLQQALDALDAITDDVDGTGLNTMPSFDKAIDAITALREALSSAGAGTGGVPCRRLARWQAHRSHSAPDAGGRQSKRRRVLAALHDNQAGACFTPPHQQRPPLPPLCLMAGGCRGAYCAGSLRKP